MSKIRAIHARGIYDLDVINGSEEVEIATIDTKRGQYYIVDPSITCDELKHEKNVEIIKEIIDEVAKKKNSGELTGDTKAYAEELLLKKLVNLGVFPISEQSHKEEIDYNEYVKNLIGYNHCNISEESMNNYCYR